MSCAVSPICWLVWHQPFFPQNCSNKSSLAQAVPPLTPHLTCSLVFWRQLYAFATIFASWQGPQVHLPIIHPPHQIHLTSFLNPCSLRASEPQAPSTVRQTAGLKPRTQVWPLPWREEMVLFTKAKGHQSVVSWGSQVSLTLCAQCHRSRYHRSYKIILLNFLLVWDHQIKHESSYLRPSRCISRSQLQSLGLLIWDHKVVSPPRLFLPIHFLFLSSCHRVPALLLLNYHFETATHLNLTWLAAQFLETSLLGFRAPDPQKRIFSLDSMFDLQSPFLRNDLQPTGIKQGRCLHSRSTNR